VALRPNLDKDFSFLGVLITHNDATQSVGFL